MACQGITLWYCDDYSREQHRNGRATETDASGYPAKELRVRAARREGQRQHAVPASYSEGIKLQAAKSQDPIAGDYAGGVAQPTGGRRWAPESSISTGEFLIESWVHRPNARFDLGHLYATVGRVTARERAYVNWQRRMEIVFRGLARKSQRGCSANSP
jgi:hypothetical protein